ncbi:MAG TPA: S46 family peptidase, partial [Myxococcales bacterium]
YGSAWDDVARAAAMFQPRRKEFKYIEQGAGFSSPLYRIARDLVRGTEELQKPNEQRLREYTDGKLPQLKQKLFSKAPIYEEFELFKLSYGLTKLREELGADHPFVKKVLGKKSPQELAQELVKTKLYDLKLREQLWQAGREAVLASNDPMIQFARLVDADARPIRMWHDEEIETLEVSGAERVAAAKFDIEGKSTYPDATFTLRLSYGTVKGYEENGRQVGPFTVIGGAFERATGRDPFKLPESWIRANDNRQLNPSTPFNMCTTNDIIGGNSGSPVFDKDLQIVGLVFDGNIQSLGGDYGFDPTVNRTISVHSSALLEALDHVYSAKRIVTELKSPTTAATTGSK